MNMNGKSFVDKISDETLAKMIDKTLNFEKTKKNRSIKMNLLKAIPAVAVIALVIGAINIYSLIYNNNLSENGNGINPGAAAVESSENIYYTNSTSVMENNGINETEAVITAHYSIDYIREQIEIIQTLIKSTQEELLNQQEILHSKQLKNETDATIRDIANIQDIIEQREKLIEQYEFKKEELLKQLEILLEQLENPAETVTPQIGESIIVTPTENPLNITPLPHHEGEYIDIIPLPPTDSGSLEVAYLRGYRDSRDYTKFADSTFAQRMNNLSEDENEFILECIKAGAGIPIADDIYGMGWGELNGKPTVILQLQGGNFVEFGLTFPKEKVFINPLKEDYISMEFNESHPAIDMAALLNEPVFASDAGIVTDTGYDSEQQFGNYIKIQHANGFETFYGQLNESLVKTGDEVYQGQEIGKVGETGYATGPHLHFGIIKDGIPVNPELYIK